MSVVPPTWLAELPVAHRGLHDATIPENSPAAFAAAADAGFGIELDVHLTADDQLAVLHDDDTLRTTGIELAVRDAPLARLTELRLQGSTETVPALLDVLDLAGETTPVLIEVKSGAPTARVGAALVSTLARRPRSRVAVQSFDPRVVLWMARHAPHVPRGQLGGRLADEGLPAVRRALLRSMVLNVATRPSFLAWEVTALDDRALRAWRRALDVPLLAWTVRDQDALHTARRAGANVIFESVDPR